jgi:antirestriction protein ArdC
MALVKFNDPTEFLTELEWDRDHVDRQIVRVTNLYRTSTVSPAIRHLSLEHGTVPWRCPWRSGGRPKNLLTQRPYRGINLWLLLSQPYTSPYWLTVRQAHELGGHVRPGAQGSPVIFWKVNADEPGTESAGEGHSPRRRPLLRSYTVFNTEQCELPASLTARLAVPQPQPRDPLSACEVVVTYMPQRPPIVHDERRAFYRPDTDVVNVPPLSLFESAEGYYASVFHELVHSTGHNSRLARPAVVNPASFASHAYSQEELLAEMGAAYLCGSCGIENITLENSAAYIQSWITSLRHDKRLLLHAATQAQQAVDFILGTSEPHE